MGERRRGSNNGVSIAEETGRLGVHPGSGILGPVGKLGRDAIFFASVAEFLLPSGPASCSYPNHHSSQEQTQSASALPSALFTRLEQQPNRVQTCMCKIHSKIPALLALVSALSLTTSSYAQINVSSNLAVRSAVTAPAGGSLKGEYWKRPVNSILTDGATNPTNRIDRVISGFGTPSGTFTATRFVYLGNDLTPVRTWLTNDSASFLGTSNNLDDGAFRFSGFINITNAGTLNIGTTSDDGSRIKIGGIDVINNDSGHGDATVDTNVVFAAAGLYPIEITYFNGDWTSDGTGTNLNHSGSTNETLHGGANFHLRVAGADVTAARAAMFYPTVPVAGINVPANLAVGPAATAAGGNLKGEYWKRPVNSIPTDGAVNPTNRIDRLINGFGTPSGTFTATRFVYLGNDLTPVRTWLTNDSSSFLGTSNNLDDGAFRFSGFINVTNAGAINIGTTSDDGSRIKIGGIDIINNDSGHGDATVDTNVVFAAAGLYPIEITYFNGDWTSDGTGTNLNHSGSTNETLHGGANFHLRVGGADVTTASAARLLYSTTPFIVVPSNLAVGPVATTAGGSLSGEYWKRGVNSIPTDGATNPTNRIDRLISGFGTPSGTFRATRFVYLGNDLTPVRTWLTNDATSFVGNASNLDDGAFRFSGFINVTNAGAAINFGTTSDDGSRIKIGGIDVINNDSGHGDATVDTNVVFAAAGLYPIEITYFNGDWTSDGTGTNLNHSGSTNETLHGGANFHLRVAGADVTPATAARFYATDPRIAQTARFSVGLSFGANEVGGTLPYSASVAGVPAVAQGNWNNLSGPNGTNVSVGADTGGTPSATSTRVSWVSNGTWASGSRGEPNGTNFARGTTDHVLMEGYLDTGNATTTSVTITNIPIELTLNGYDVYVYALGGVAGRGGAYRILDAGTRAVLKDYVRVQSPSLPTTYSAVPTPLPGSTNYASGTYLVFGGLKASSIILEATTAGGLGFSGTPRAPVNALQLVAIPGIGSPQSVTVTNGLVAYWSFDGNLQDSIRTAHGTARGPVPVGYETRAGFGQSLKLNGTNFVEITGSSNTLRFASNSLSIAGWFRVDTFDKSWQALIAKGENLNYRIARNSAGNNIAYAGGVAEGANDVPPITNGWHHFVAVTDASKAKFGTALYIDGIIRGINTNAAVLAAGTANLFIGENPEALNRQWNGGIDDIALWSRVLTPDEIALLYNGGTGRPLSAIPSLTGPVPSPALITQVAETGGDNEATDTIVAKWTGQTFPVSVVDEPFIGAAIGTSYKVGFFGNHAPTFVDRNHRYTNASATVLIPSYLVGGEYIMSGNDNRDNTNYVLNVTVSQAVQAYLLIDNRLSDTFNTNAPTFDATHMQWVKDQGWSAVAGGNNRLGIKTEPDEIGIDEGADGTINNWYSIYTKAFPAGTFQLKQADNAGQNMYGVVITPPAQFTSNPILSIARQGANLVINLPAGYRLQSTTSLRAPVTWTNVTGSSPFTIPLSGAGTFYRGISP
jgi:hypothetical protein